MDKKIERYFEKYGIGYEEFGHEKVFTVEESKKLKKEIPGMHCKCLFLKDSNGKFYLVGMSAFKRLDIKNLKKYFEVRKLQFGNEKELWNKLKLKPGSVSIFGLINNGEKDVTLILDEDVWEAEMVGFHPNVNTATLVLTHGDLKDYLASIDNKKVVVEL
jgi:Ala-tRNA(Pro) deacylase